MRKPKHYSVLEVLNFSEVGLVFEFYSSKNSNFIVEDLSKLTAKNIILTNEDNFNPSYTSAILLKEYEATRSRYSLSLARQNYHSVIPIIDGVSEWISEHCETTLDTQLKISLSFNHRNLETISSISLMNPTRLMLKFDESFVYSRFPEQRFSPYALSIKTLVPTKMYINEADIEKNIKYILTTAYAEFYGINFSEYTRGILECNYIGGKNYAAKPKEIKDILEYFILKTYQSINEEEDFNDFEKTEIKRITENFDIMQQAYWDPEIFLREFTDLKVFIDLKTSTQMLKTYWTHIRDPLFEMIITGGLRKGVFNLDTEISRFQLRGGKCGGITTKNMDFISCELTGVLENCTFIGCTLNRARVYNSKFVGNNKINESYLEGVSVNKGNKITKSFVYNNEEIINCEIFETVVKFATPGKYLSVDESSTVIVRQEALPHKTESVNVEEIRDYSWIKAMNHSEDQGFQNIYIRKGKNDITL